MKDETPPETPKLQTKRRHHYVWQKYLRAWETGGRVWCRRGAKEFASNTVNLAVESYFYRIFDLLPDERTLIAALMGKSHPLLRQLHAGWMDSLAAPFELEKGFQRVFGQNDDADAVFEHFKSEGEEVLHTNVENRGAPLLDRIREADLSFFEDAQAYIDFTFFLPVQYFRTKKMRDAAAGALDASLRELRSKLEVRPGVVAAAMAQTFATNVSYALVAEKDAHRYTLLRAPPGSEFLTSDQPVVNLDALNTPEGQAPDQMVLLYPVSPELALHLEKVPGRPALTRTRELSAEEVDAYNQAVVDLSHEQLFATTKDVLSRYRRGPSDPVE